MAIKKAMPLRYAIRQQWCHVRFLVRWKTRRYIWKSITAALWRMTPRLRQEFGDYEQGAWAADAASMEFSEWLGARIWK